MLKSSRAAFGSNPINCTQSPLIITSYLAPNMLSIYTAIAEYIGRKLRQEVHISQSQYNSPLEDPAILNDSIDFAFMCGLPLTLRSLIAPDQYSALVAPVPVAPRYKGKPIYFSDILVDSDSHYKTFNDLQGSRFGYNDLGSNSGYNVTRHYLLKKGWTNGFFSELTMTGSHQNSMQAILLGEVDCASIDSLVWERAIQVNPDLARKFRSVKVLGPFPMPPLVASNRHGREWIEQVTNALNVAHLDPALGAVLGESQIQFLAPVALEDYNILGNMAREAEAAGFSEIK